MSEQPTSSSGSQAANPAERRLAKRYQCSKDTVGRLTATGSGEYWAATIRDISANGIGLIMPRRFETGTLLIFEVHNPAQDFNRTVLARVMRISAVENDSWLVGCALPSPLSEEELNVLRADKDRVCRNVTTARERRAWVQCNSNSGNIGDTASPAEQWPATVLNLGAARIGLLVPRSFKRGSLLKVNLQPSSENPSQSFIARVLNSHAQFDGEWELTCSLSKYSSAQETHALPS